MNIKSAKFDFDHNVIIISGKSGQGKSAVFDAISLCLSRKKRSNSYADYVRQGCSHAKVLLDAFINGEPVIFDLQINLHRGTPFQMDLTYKGEIFKNAEAESVIKSFDIDYFNDIIFSMQSDDFKDITQLSPTQRSNYLQRLLNFDFIDEKEIISKANEEYSIRIKDLETEISLKKRFIEKERESEEKEIEILLKEKDIENFQNEIDVHRKTIEAYQEQQKEMTKINTEVSILKNALLEQNIKKNETLNAIARIEEYKRIHKDAETRFLELTKKIREVESNHKIEMTDLEKLEKDKEALLAELREKDRRFLFLSESRKEYEKYYKLIQEEKCPTCGQDTIELGETHLEKFLKDSDDLKDASLLEVLGIEKEEDPSLEKVLEALKDKIEVEHNLRSNLQSELALVTSSINKKERKRIILESQQESLKVEKDEVEKKINSKEVNFEELLELNKTIKELEKSIALTSAEISEKELFLKENSKTEDIGALSEKILKINTAINDYYSDIKMNEEIKKRNANRLLNIKNFEKEIEAFSKELTSVRIEKTTYEEAFAILDKTLPIYMIVKTAAILQKEMNSFIQSVFPSYEVQLQNSKKGCEFFYTKDKSIVDQPKKRMNSWLNSKMSSGFEKALLTTAFKVSLAQLYGINIFIGDEVDGAADAESSEQFFEMLTSNTTFNQLFLISHKKSICRLILDTVSDSVVYTVENGQFSLLENVD